MRNDSSIKRDPKVSRLLIGRERAALKWLPIILLCAFLLAAVEAPRARSLDEQRVVRITPSLLMKMVRDRVEREPGMSDGVLAAYANGLLSQKGFDYQFDVCEFIRLLPQKRRAVEPPPSYRFQLTQASGGKIAFEIGNDDVSDGMCGECFFAFPSLGVTGREILLLLGGRQYRLRRPSLFRLDEMSLVDSSMKRVLRTWEVPYQSMPLGISADGTHLYISTELDRLALEIAPSGLSFKATSQIEVRDGKEVEKHPRDPGNAYLGFMRFRSGQRSYIIRYSAPCT
jgi:hypothetical protein